ALFASARGAAGGSFAILLGILLGLGVLGVVYYVIQRYGLKLPLKPFFAVTSALLYVMAFSFAGQGIAELQEAGYIGAALGAQPAGARHFPHDANDGHPARIDAGTHCGTGVDFLVGAAKELKGS